MNVLGNTKDRSRVSAWNSETYHWCNILILKEHVTIDSSISWIAGEECMLVKYEGHYCLICAHCRKSIERISFVADVLIMHPAELFLRCTDAKINGASPLIRI